MINLPKDTEMTKTLLQKLLDIHKKEVEDRFSKLYEAYKSNHDILHLPKKAAYKPDNRIVINFPKYIVDTMNGFFIGHPIKITTDNEDAAKFVEHIDQYNNIDKNNAQLSKLCSIFGKANEMYYTDEEAELCITYLSPIDAFMVFDDSILARPMFFIRRYTDMDNKEWGSISNKSHVRHFRVTGGIEWTDEWEPHYFDGVPATEYVENDEKQGLFEPILTAVNAYNKALSEKANDVDYFADAYLKILGPKLENGDLKFIRDNRVVNFDGEDASKIIAEFMSKPSADTTQENLLDRLERLIFTISMVANINDENFGTSSGIAMKYKLQNMSNLEKNKELMFTSGMNRRYKLLFSHPACNIPKDEWVGLHYHFTPNFPANLLEEAQIASQMDGIVSHETQLKSLSIVDNVKEEIERMENEDKPQESIIDRQLKAALNLTEGGTDEQ